MTKKTLFLVVLLFAVGTTAAWAAEPNDPLISNQDYLRQIHAYEAWDIAKRNTDIIIAVVDTGIDLDHPDLKDNLVPGANLIQPSKPPMDDKGHGTNVAGVLAAAADNDKGIAGLLWNAKIMPIKALESDGTGDEEKLGEGIRYAVDHGAKIVVLSLGINKYSSYMSAIIDYAEERGVLLVAAAGNEGNAVRYPAAYPTVLAVGGVGKDNKPEALSNFGPELDIVAPWDVFTTAIRGTYTEKNGTSLAAPQVAAVSALLWSIHPEWKPYQIRNAIRQSAEDLETPGWDPVTGFGLLRADRALALAYRDDMFEPNDTLSSAKPLPVNSSIDASFANANDNDWFVVDAPYDGLLRVQLIGEDAGLKGQLVHYSDSAGAGVSYNEGLSSGVEIPLLKGKSYLKLQSQGVPKGQGVYHLKTDFRMHADAFEDNDRQFKAYVLPNRSQTVVGTFHAYRDDDWFAMIVDQPGTLQIKLAVDTARIDPVLLIQRKGDKEIIIDERSDGETETSMPLEVTPGTYYIRVSNIAEYAYPVVGEYMLNIDFSTRYEDPNEPNDKPYQAALIELGTGYQGVLDTDADVDWFKFKLNGENLVHFKLTDIPIDRVLTIGLTDASLAPLQTDLVESNYSSVQLDAKLAGGTYYVKLTADRSFNNQLYSLVVDAEPLVSGYADIGGHWAETAIAKLTAKQIVNGYAPYRFGPDRTLTRAEAVTMFARAFGLKGGQASYTDVSLNHWAKDAIAAATRVGIVSGYGDGTFRPDSPVTRMELTAMLAHALGFKPISGPSPYADVDDSYWGSGILRTMKAEGWVQGFEDGRFLPGSPATRAQIAALLAKTG
ncbi:S8 family serine peptidase [Paenibacillus sp. MBLB4367]|uniref:S8 family serine peptidase n=1 Tax=Paenibacillus sp. MBLB4367 TaxID=3384767 RepID=UPI00390820C9